MNILSWDVSETHLIGIIKNLKYTEHWSFVLGPHCIKKGTCQGTHAWDEVTGYSVHLCDLSSVGLEGLTHHKDPQKTLRPAELPAAP